jgi:hypothetical protein
MKIYTTFLFFTTKIIIHYIKNKKTQIMIKYTPQFNKKYTPIFKLFTTKIIIDYIKNNKN